MNSKSSIGSESVCETGKLTEENILLSSYLLTAFLWNATALALSKVISHATA
jgi:hypothetical protein